MAKRPQRSKFTETEGLGDICLPMGEEDEMENESHSSVDSLDISESLSGKDPDFRLESDSDSELEVQRPGKRQRASSSKNHKASPCTSQPAGKGRGRASLKAAQSVACAWKTPNDQDEHPRRPIFCPRRDPGPQLVQGKDYSALQLFCLFMSNSVLQVIVNNTNKYGRQQLGGTWQDITMEDMYSFLALVIYMGLLSAHQIPDYWKISKLYSLPFPMSVMSGRKFRRISSHLHISDPEKDIADDAKRGTPQYDRLGKIKPMYEQIRDACKAFYHPRQNIAVDERMVASKARTALRQYMKNKPVKWGYKLFVLADSLNGYTWDFFIYEGRSVGGKGLRYDSVMHLVSTQVLGSGYKLFVDNFYTSPALFSDLMEKKIWACGTIRSNLTGFPKDRPGALERRSPRGSLRWIREGPLLFIQWRDKRDVSMCSTIHTAHGKETVRRRVKGQDGQWTVADVPVPPAIKDYNKNMGGVDVSDALIGYYSVLHKTMKWYKSFFMHFLDIAIVNAFILHKDLAIQKGNKPLTQKVFRETLVGELKAAGSPPPPAPAPAPVTAPVHASHHKPVYFAENGSKGRRRCVYCDLKTPIRCGSCNVSLCFNLRRDCYNEWHNIQEDPPKSQPS